MQKAATALAENTGVISANRLVPEPSRFSLSDVPDLTSKVAVVTGGSEGVGYGVVHTFLSHNISKIFIISRSADVFADFKRRISDADSDQGGLDRQQVLDRVVWKQCDLSRPRDVVAAAGEILNETDRLDILVNCAGRGIMTPQLSDDGIDLHMAVNHVGHALLTSRLLPLLKRTSETLDDCDKVRIVNVSSVSHESAPKHVQFESLDEINANHGPNAQYGQSKLAVLLHARWLARRLAATHPNILVNASHPGVVDTRQSRDHIREPWPVAGQLVRALKPVKKDVFDGCVSTVFCATAAPRSGEYVCPPAVVEEGSDLSRDEALADRLMMLTARILDDRRCSLKEL
jgi:NAD(P)-dependent dehydrogenase (short-subunit alcohol dehydrogenase family)